MEQMLYSFSLLVTVLKGLVEEEMEVIKLKWYLYYMWQPISWGSSWLQINYLDPEDCHRPEMASLQKAIGQRPLLTAE